MDGMRIFLSTPLFTEAGGEGHAPRGVMVLEGPAALLDSGWVRVRPEGWRDERGRPLEPAPAAGTELLLPAHKIDHLAPR